MKNICYSAGCDNYATIAVKIPPGPGYTGSYTCARDVYRGTKLITVKNNMADCIKHQFETMTLPMTITNAMLQLLTTKRSDSV